MMELFRKVTEADGGGSAVAEVVPEKTVVSPDVAEADNLDRTRGILDTMIEGADPEREFVTRLVEVSKEHRGVLLELFPMSFTKLEAEWEELRQKLQSGSDMTRENDEVRLGRIEEQLKALGAMIDALGGSDDDTFSKRARRHSGR